MICDIAWVPLEAPTSYLINITVTLFDGVLSPLLCLFWGENKIKDIVTRFCDNSPPLNHLTPPHTLFFILNVNYISHLARSL